MAYAKITSVTRHEFLEGFTKYRDDLVRMTERRLRAGHGVGNPTNPKGRQNPQDDENHEYHGSAARGIAEDIVHDVLIELLEKRKYEEFRGDSSFKTWLIGTVRTGILRWGRQRGQQQQRQMRPIWSRLEDDEPRDPRSKAQGQLAEPWDQLTSAQAGQERRELEGSAGTTEQGLKEAVQSALKSVPDEVRTIMYRHYADGETWAKVANDLGMNEKTLQSLVHSYFPKLQEQLKHYEP